MESRAGVIINSRGNIEDGVSDVTIENLTMDHTGYPKNGEFDTLTVGKGRTLPLITSPSPATAPRGTRAVTSSLTAREAVELSEREVDDGAVESRAPPSTT